jgi:3-oxoacyl-[acyl-carrier protein] reductase
MKSHKKVALITGASGGLGKALARAFGENGCAVALNYFQGRKEAESVLRELQGTGVSSDIFQADIRDSKSVGSMIDGIVKRWGGVDVLVNNSGITRDGLCVSLTEQEWDDVIDVNTSGVFNVTKAVLQRMVRHRSGCIIMIASYLALCGGYAATNYAASKGALLGMTKSLAKEYGGKGIRVNAVCPGFMLTDMGVAVPEKAVNRVRESNVLKRLNDPDEAAGFIAYLSEMQNVSGQVFNLDSRIVP